VFVCSQAGDYLVTVHSLKSSSDYAILDEDDLIRDVADDRDQV
jgi:N-terminal of Par3 and HAL proteins